MLVFSFQNINSRVNFFFIINYSTIKNFYHVLINNGVHESVGGQATAISSIDIVSIIKSSGYNDAISIDTKEDLVKYFFKQIETPGPIFIEVKVDAGSRDELGRPTVSPIANKRALMDNIKKI